MDISSSNYWEDNLHYDNVNVKVKKYTENLYSDILRKTSVIIFDFSLDRDKDKAKKRFGGLKSMVVQKRKIYGNKKDFKDCMAYLNAIMKYI